MSEKGNDLIGKTEMKLKDTITKQDLVEYAITKKVDEITVVRTATYKKYKKKSKEREAIKKEIAAEKINAEERHIQDNYGDVITLLEKKFGTKHFVMSKNQASKIKGRSYYMFRELMYHGDIVIVIPKKGDDKVVGCGRGEYGWDYDYYPEEMMSEFLAMGTMITVDQKDITSDKLDELNAKYEVVDAECKELDKEKKSYDRMIQKVKNQRDTIKASIVEQALAKSDSGQEMLVALQNIDFGIKGIKLLS